MEEEEDDFYGAEGLKAEREYNHAKQRNQPQDSRMDDDEDSEEDSSDDDVTFELEKPAGAKTEPTATSRFKREATPQQRATSIEPKNSQASPAVKQETRADSTAPPTAVKGALTHRRKEGNDFPEVRTSKIDVSANPVWPANGKPITELDLDADLAESSRLWRLPGTDQTDFFNYGFDEYTWAQYCLRQQQIPTAIADQKQQDAQMKAMFGGGGTNGNGANAGMPPGMPAMPTMPGMPSPEEFFHQMMSSGMNPNDPDQFMQMMMSSGMPGMPGMPGGGQQNQQQGGGGGGFGGPNQNQKTSSPNPQTGQGFQPPTGPSNPQGDQGSFANMDGYSPQQIAIMQQQGAMGAPTGPTGPRRGGRRGRGFY